MSENKTCGPLYFEAREMLIDTENHDEVRAYASGFAVGLAEKVMLGACPAAMMRPAPADFDWLWKCVETAVDNYGLLMRVLQVGEYREIWILRNRSTLGVYLNMREMEVNSAGYHTLRAFLCGIPPDEIDLAFHERQSLYPSATPPEKSNG